VSIASAVGVLASTLAATDGKAVSYHRSSASVALTAVVGRTAYEAIDDSGVVVQGHARDYLVQAEDLVLDGSETLPEPGDTIQEAIRGEARIFEVMPLPGEACYHYSDAGRTRLRIHTRERANA